MVMWWPAVAQAAPRAVATAPVPRIPDSHAADGKQFDAHRTVGVDGRVFAEAPPRVEYALSALGVSFVDGPLRAMGDWVLEHGDALRG